MGKFLKWKSALSAAIALLAPLVLITQSSQASVFEDLIMPGPVIEGHAKYEKKCSECHSPFKKGSQKKLCLDCHKKVRADVYRDEGFHGISKTVKDTECRHCHTEHKGRDADIVRFDSEVFDHDNTDFLLKDGHAKIRCAACHEKKDKYREAKPKCIDCHKDDDTHQGRLGKNCKDCHSEKTWSKARYDHDETDFPLKGEHKKTGCTNCHPNERYEATPKDCYSCHLLNDVHRGRYGKKCEECHNEKDWEEQDFDHDETDYPLKFKHKKVACNACHTKPVYENGKKGKKLGDKCYTCHKNDDVHKERYGKKCEECHTEREWQKDIFDHDETDYPLEYEHKDVKCDACHRGPVYTKKKLGSKCYTCHKNDDVHNEKQGKTCRRCHNVRGWTKKVFFDHDLSEFPLVGLHATASCEACHLTPAYKDTKRECNACHKPDDEHESKLGPECGACHNPNGWRLWLFDHDKDTEFELDGKHKDVECLSCHTKPMKKKLRTPKSCSGCHYEEDIHRGGFGLNCKRCHVTKSFKEIDIK